MTYSDAGALGGIGSPITTALSGSTRGTLREEIAVFFGFHEGTATGGSTSTVVDSKLARFTDDHFNGANVWIESALGAAPEDEDTFISDFAASSGTMTLNPALTAAVASGDTYHVFMVVTKAEIDTAIARACIGSDAIYTLTVSTSTLDYDLTHIIGLRDSRQVRAVWLRSANDNLTQPLMVRGWDIEDNFGQLTLRLPYTPNSNDALWVEYQLDETGMADDATRSNLPMRLVKARALAHLLENLMSKQDASGRDKYGQLLRYWQDERQAEEARLQPKSNLMRSSNVWRNLSRRGDRALAALDLNDHSKYQP